ncbi:unnamed protein product [Rhodiola kirilowii]
MGKDDRPPFKKVGKGGAPPPWVTGNRRRHLLLPKAAGLLPFLHMWPSPPLISSSNQNATLVAISSSSHGYIRPPPPHFNTPQSHFTSLSRSCNICNVVILALEIKDSSLGASTVNVQGRVDAWNGKTLQRAEKRLVEEVRNHDTLIVVGETGSGKTTQLPQYLMNAGFSDGGRIVGVTQPRRVAAVTVAKRVAEECGVELGKKVGYSIRFDDKTSNLTRIKYMTDGLLLREALLDPYLSRYSVIIVDEAHERTVHTDVLLGLLKHVQILRSKSVNGVTNANNPDAKKFFLFDNKNMSQDESIVRRCNSSKLSPLKLIIMSASLDARVFSEYFGGAKAVHIQGRQYPVDIFYTLQPETDYLDAALITIIQIHLKEEAGDILVFLTGQEEIESVERFIREKLQQLPEDNRKLLPIPIYASLPYEKQMQVFKPAPNGIRKVILATNIAETSVTIPGIKYVIDPGMVKAKTYNAKTGVESLVIVQTSKAQALQRRGRAGREGPGKCYRLYPETKSPGVDDIIGFDFMEKPSRMAIVKSLEQLYLLGAITDEYKLSDPVGIQMARLPLDPMYSKALILANEFKCLDEMLVTVAMLSAESIFYAPCDKLQESRASAKNFSDPEGDHITLINVFRSAHDFLNKSEPESSHEKTEKKLRKWCKDNFVDSRSLKHARDIHSQIQRQVQQMGFCISSCGDDMMPFRKCLAASFFLNAAEKQPDGTYRALSSSQVVQIHPSSVLFRKRPECIIFNELVRTNNNYIRTITRIDPMWLIESVPQYFALQS